MKITCRQGKIVLVDPTYLGRNIITKLFSNSAKVWEQKSLRPFCHSEKENLGLTFILWKAFGEFR